LSVDDAGHRSLAVRDLLRGETTELPSGVTVARLVGAAPLNADELEQSRPEGTPLWLHILTSPSTAAVETGLVLQRQLVVTVVDGRVGGSGMFGPGAVVGVARSTSAGRSARRSRGRGRGWRAGGGSRCCSTGSGRRRRLSGRLWVPLF